VIDYAARAVPWRLVLAGCLVTTALMAIVAVSPDTMWPLQGTAIGLLAGLAAWSMDETAAALVDALPRPLAWRTAARALGIVPLALTWCASVLTLAGSLPPHTSLFLLQGTGAMLFAVACVTWRRAHGNAVPGTAFASCVVPLVALLAITRPLPQHLALFPIWSDESWHLCFVIWSTLAGGSAALLTAALSPGSSGTPLRRIEWRAGARGTRAVRSAKVRRHRH